MSQSTKKSVLLPSLKDKGALRKYGYSLKKSSENREIALKKAAKKDGSLEIIRRLNYIRILSKSRPIAYKKYTKDIKYVQNIRKKEKTKKIKLKSILKKNKNKKKKGGNRVTFFL
jgi:hypothetical protein